MTVFYTERGVALTRTCEECGKVFDLLTAAGAEDFCYGHDCEGEVMRGGVLLDVPEVPEA